MQPRPPEQNFSTWFLLGREPLLSAAEIFSLLNIGPNDEYDYSVPFLRVRNKIDDNFILKLGGTIKIAEQLCEEVGESSLIELIKNLLRKTEGKIVFGISLYGKGVSEKIVERWGKQIKKDLKSEGRSVRYVFKNETNLSSVTVEKNDLTSGGFEFLVQQKNPDAFLCAKTIAVQPFESFGARDFGRPGRDAESGMLPPKLALMMYNLTRPNPNGILLDPFCGSGTVLCEAYLQGQRKLIGTDLSEKAISDTKTNFEWTKNSNPSLSAEIKIEVADATKLTTIISPSTVEMIATEPYMGRPLRGSEQQTELDKQANELLNLYKLSFGQFSQILKPGARIIFVVPQFITRGFPIVISDRLVDEIKKFGFEPEPLLPEKIFSSPFIVYRRADQRVAREIWKFKFKG